MAAHSAPLSPLHKDGFPLIVISHGLGGNDWGHHLLAQTLVRHGFVVAAIKHPEDFKRAGHPEVTILRPSELAKTIDHVLNDPTFGAAIDPKRIGAFGYSLGGYTVLSAAGAQTEYARIEQHCAHATRDPNYCLGEPGGAKFPLWLRILQATQRLPVVDLDMDVHDKRIAAIAVAAPLAQVVSDASRVTIPTLLIRAGNDKELVYPFHAEHLHTLLPATHDYKVIEDLGHYAFLGPFPATITAEVGAPAQDPEGFDRAAFLEDINAEIAAFFVQSLAKPD
jgi:predicted dienelactone hydrolase